MPDESPDPRRGYHDLGGLPGGPIDRGEHQHEPWEKQVDAIMSVVGRSQGLITTDELRRGIESLGREAYETLSYYERWIASITTILIEKGVLDRAEIDARIETLRATDDEAT